MGSGDSYGAGAECVSIAFINNMPDAALEDTEMQFFELLDAASGEFRFVSSFTRCPEFLAESADSSI